MWIKLTNVLNKHPILINSNRVCSVVKHSAKDVSVVCFSEDDFFYVVETIEEIEAMLGIAETNKLLSKHILCLELSERSSNCLASADINTIGCLIKKTEKDLLNITNMGLKSITEVKIALGNLGLSLAK